MKAKQLAEIYNNEPNKAQAIVGINQNFVMEYKWLCQVRGAIKYSQMAMVFRELRNKYKTFANYSGLPENGFNQLMENTFPIETQNINLILQVQN